MTNETHHDGCWRYHHECAIARIEALYAQVNEFKNLKSAMADIAAERANQIEKWGDQHHDLMWWAAILSEQSGEFAKAARKHMTSLGGRDSNWKQAARTKAIHVAALATAIVEDIDRNGDVITAQT